MELEYFDLLSNHIRLVNVGTIISPTIESIEDITISEYRLYLGLITLTLETYNENLLKKNQDLKNYQKFYEVIQEEQELQKQFVIMFNYFFEENVAYNREDNKFYLYIEDANQKLYHGIIDDSNFDEIRNVLARINMIKMEDEIDISKVKSKKARERLEKFKKFKQQNKKNNKADKKMSLGNVQSCVAVSMGGFPIVKKLTVAQLYDSFSRLQLENTHYVNSTNVAVWGDKEKKFNINQCFDYIGN